MSISEILQNKFVNTKIIEEKGKIFVENNTKEILTHIKTDLGFDMLLSLYATDYRDYIELNYYLYSSVKQEYLTITTHVTSNTDSVTDVFKSAYFDECEIYDMFGVNFTGNNNLKRLLMPADWKGHPLLKNYEYEKEAVYE
ncbi:NADH-quinone oxidoreductase subunit C [bacterium]|nr:NADH-quinone oxidoreductase subunit C [bacterium]